MRYLVLAAVLATGCVQATEPTSPAGEFLMETTTLTLRPIADGTVTPALGPFNSFPYKVGVSAWEYLETVDGGYLYETAASCKVDDLVRPENRILSVTSRYFAGHVGDRDEGAPFPPSYVVPGLVIDGETFTEALIAPPADPPGGWVELAWPTNPATGKAWKAADFLGARVEPYFGYSGPGSPQTSVKVDALELVLELDTRGPRESILRMVETLLNGVGKPAGVPPATRASDLSPAAATDLPDIVFYPVRDKVFPAHADGEGAAPGTPASNLVRRALDVAVRITAKRTGGSTPDTEIDPLSVWVEQTITGADWASIGAISASKIAEDFDQTIRDKAVASSTTLYRVYYSTRAGDQSVPT